MKVLCNNCGFNKIFGKKNSNSKENDAGKLCTASGSLTNSPRNVAKTHFHTVDENQSEISVKPIAGLLATSVGSINHKLDILFNKHGYPVHSKNNASSANISLEESHYPDSYVNLEECESGMNTKKTKYFQKEANTLNITSSSLDDYAVKQNLDGSDSLNFQETDSRTSFKVQK